MFEAIAGIVGRLGVVLLALLENVFPPIPSERVMPLAGFVSSRSETSFTGAIVAGWLGALLGAVGWDGVGRRLGKEPLHGWLDRHGRWLALGGEDVQRAFTWFERHGAAAVFFGRLSRACARSSRCRAGRLLGAQYRRVEQLVEPATWVVIAAIVLFPIVRTLRRRRAGGAPGADDRRQGATTAPRE